MREELAGAGLGQPHEVFDLQVVVEFGLLFGWQRAGFLPLDEIPDALAGRLGRLEVNDSAGTECGHELDEFFVWFHDPESIGKRAVCERLFGEWRGP